MAAHPLEAILATGVSVNKATLKAEIKKYARDWDTVAAFRLIDMDGVTAAIIAGSLYIYDPADLTTADNGTTCVHDVASRRFIRQSTSISGSVIFTASSVAGTNTITANTDGMGSPSATVKFVYIKLANTITGAATIAFDGGAALDLLSPTGAALATGEAVAGVPMLLAVTSTDVRIVATGMTW